MKRRDQRHSLRFPNKTQSKEIDQGLKTIHSTILKNITNVLSSALNKSLKALCKKLRKLNVLEALKPVSCLSLKILFAVLCYYVILMINLYYNNIVSRFVYSMTFH